ncbi:MAG: tetratricopeptide repeat protein, partial [Bacteroidetes bacterium]|nr:tetratricopeptide repeat protein [Bacteroidota bacterium]
MKIMTPTYLPFVSCLLFFTCFSGYAQSPLDSLLKLYNPQAADTSQARVINALVNSYMYSDKTKARRFIRKGLELSNRLNFTWGKALFHYQWGVFYTEHIELDSSQYHYNRSLQLAKEADDLSRQAAVYYGLAILAFNRGELEESEKMVRENMALDIQLGDSMGLALSYGFIGSIYRNKGNYQIALKNVLKSLKLIESLGNPIREADALNILAAIEYNLGHYEQSIQYNLRAANIYELHKDLSYQAQTFNDIGNCYQRLESYDQAIEYYKKSMEKAEAAGVRSIYGSALSNLGKVRVLHGKTQEGLAQLQQSLGIFEELGLERKVAVTQNILAETYIHLRQAEKALPLLNASIAYSKKANSRSTLMGAYLYRSQAFELLGNDPHALKDFKFHKNMSDSLLNLEKIKQIEELRIIHDTEKKEDSLALNKIQIQALEQEVQLSQFRNSLYIGGIVSLLAIAGLLVF